MPSFSFWSLTMVGWAEGTSVLSPRSDLKMLAKIFGTGICTVVLDGHVSWGTAGHLPYRPLARARSGYQVPWS